MKKVLYGVLILGWIPTLLIVTGTRWLSGEPLFAQGRTPVTITRLYTGPNGKTQVEEFEFPLQPRGQGSEGSADEIPLTTLRIRRTSADYFLDWHPASRRQLVVTLSGENQVELDGGRTLRFGPGHITLVEDTTGQGHISSAIKGSPDRITLDIGLAEGAVIPRK